MKDKTVQIIAIAQLPDWQILRRHFMMRLILIKQASVSLDFRIQIYKKGDTNLQKTEETRLYHLR